MLVGYIIYDLEIFPSFPLYIFVMEDAMCGVEMCAESVREWRRHNKPYPAI